MPKTSRREIADDLRPEYDFRALRVVARGPGRKGAPAVTVRLAADVAEAFGDSDSVNSALRLLIGIAKGQVKRAKLPKAAERVSNLASQGRRQKSARR